MGSWFVRPETVTLPLSEGQWILVKKRLNAGEQRATFARMYLAGVDGTLKVNPLQTGLAQITAYLLDWSLTDDEGKPVVIRDTSVESLTAILNNLAPARFKEINTAIDQHVEAMETDRTAEKNAQAGETSAPKISPSPSDVTGALSGSVN